MKCKCVGATSSKGNKGDTGATGATGAAGAAGAAGTNGAAILYNTVTPVSNATGVGATLQSYTLPINKLAADGDSIIVEALCDVDVTTSSALVLIYLNASAAHLKIPAFLISPGVKYVKVKMTATRKSATRLFLDFESAYTSDGIYTVVAGQAAFESNFLVNNLTSATNLIEVTGTNLVNTLTCQQMKVTFFKTV